MAIKARFTEQVVVMVTPEVRDELDRRAIEQEVSVSQVVRKALDRGLATEERVD